MNFKLKSQRCGILLPDPIREHLPSIVTAVAPVLLDCRTWVIVYEVLLCVKDMDIRLEAIFIVVIFIIIITY